MNIGSKIVFLPQCSSTNDLAKESAEMGEAHGTIFRCNAQTAGRGKEGRRWYSVAGKGLYFSIILRPQKNISICWLPHISGISICESLKENFGISPSIKWPNDVFLEGKKLSGILIESSFGSAGIEYAIVGIGINVNHNLDDFPEELRNKATSIKIAVGKEVDMEFLFEKLVEKFNFWYKMLVSDHIYTIKKYLCSLSFIPVGSEIEVSDGENRFKGEFRGFDFQGALLLRKNKKIHKIYSGEISF